MPVETIAIEVWAVVVDDKPIDYNQSFDHAFVAARRAGGKTRRMGFASLEALEAWAAESLP